MNQTSYSNETIVRKIRQLEKEFNDTVIAEVRTGGAICRNEQRKWELCYMKRLAGMKAFALQVEGQLGK